MAITLLEAAKLAVNKGETLRAAVIAMFANGSEWLAAMPFNNIPGNAYAYNREGELPGVAFRGLNEAYPESAGVINQLSEALKIGGGDLDVDVATIKMMGLGVRSAHEALKAKALAQAISRTMIKGDSETNQREFDGLQKRLTGNQLVPAGNTSGGNALSLQVLDEAIDNTVNPTGILLNKKMRRRITRAARDPNVGGQIDFVKDDFGRQITTYNGIPLLVPYPDNGGTEPVAFDEVAPAGGAAQTTSIYVVSFGDGMVSGIQNDTMEVRDLGELDAAPVYRTRVEWLLAMVVENGRAATRLAGITDAAVVA
jgi:hypothetical protein